MKPNLYIPSPVLLPSDIINDNKLLMDLLLEYMEDLYFFGPPYKVLEWYGGPRKPVGEEEITAGRFKVKAPSMAQKSAIILKEKIPLYYDAVLVNDKLLAIGPYLPGIDEVIGEPKLYLTHKLSKQRQEASYFRENFIPPAKKGYTKVNRCAVSYLVIESLSPELLLNPSDWELHFEYKEFTSVVSIQNNPFIGGQTKLTLLCVQKDQPADRLANWCDHYASAHGVERIIVYNNDPIDKQKLPELPIKNNVELWYVEWSFSHQLKFTSCQSGAYTHAYWWIKDAAPYMFNFDPDEFLVNESGLSLKDYLKKRAPAGIRVYGYEVPQDIPLPREHNKEMIKLATAANKDCTKYVFSNNYWHTLFVHSARRYTFIINPAYWTMLEYSSRNFRFFIAKYFYKVFFVISRVFSIFLRMKRPAPEDIYYLHYRSLNTYWLYSKETLSDLKK